MNEQSGALALCLLLLPPHSGCASQLSGSLLLAGPKVFLLLWLEEGGKELMGSKLGKVESVKYERYKESKWQKGSNASAARNGGLGQK